ncbi:MAG: type II toxin-antitoxin system HipA family toxin [Psychromonas sp.]|nr:type II toxin-antitoxin system HipA family toxin [Psychromonas sp.]
MDTLTIQAFLKSSWQDIATIEFPLNDDQSYYITEIEYFDDYAITHLEKDDHHAVSINHAVQLYFDNQGVAGWLKFLDDIMPSGSSRRYWLNYLDISDLTIHQQNYILLKYGAISPIGNLRIKEAVLEVKKINIHYFTVDEVKNRASDFLSYVQSRGAAAGGATGAGGEAPKLLLRCSSDKKIWIDTYQEDNQNNDEHYLVKFPRGKRTVVDNDILRAEFYYYHELEAMGFNTISTDTMWLIEGDHYPSLWLPRFDIVRQSNSKVKRFAMESVYSMLKKSPGAILSHNETIRELINLIQNSHTIAETKCIFNIKDFIVEWVRRDLLNVIFGNSDNHGRNTSFLRDEEGIKLSPIYDFAPMRADSEGIPRTTKWDLPLEIGGEFDFKLIANSLCDLIEPDLLLKKLKITALQLITLKQRLQDRGVPESIIGMPIFGFDYIEIKMKKWGLL